MRWIGLDVHKHYVQVLELSESRDPDYYRIALPDGLPEFCQRLTPDCQLAMEASTSTFRLAEILSLHAGRVLVVDPGHVRAVMPPGVATDRTATGALARLLRSDFLRQIWVPTPEIRDLRCLVTHHENLGHSRNRLINQLRSLLNQELVQAPRDLLSRNSRSFLDGLFLEQPGCRLCLCGLLRQLDQVTGELAETGGALERWSRHSPDAQLLMTIPGVGPLGAAILISQIGDILRFPSARRLCAYAGLAPQIYQSGKTLRHGRLRKASNHHIRWVLTLVSWAQTRQAKTREPNALDLHREQLGLRRPRRVVHAAMARKLLTIIWSMLTHQRPFREQDEGLSERKARRLARVEGPSPEAYQVPQAPPVRTPASSRTLKEHKRRKSPVASNPGEADSVNANAAEGQSSSTR